MKHSYPTSERLKFLLELVHNRAMALPDFQRDFVWEPYATKELVESVISNFPAGSLLRIASSHHLVFQPRAVAGAPPLEGAKPPYLILDGQQRLTSLYQALYGVGEHRYYIDLDALDNKKDLEDCVFYLRVEDAKVTYGTSEQQAARLVFPLGHLFGGGGYAAWMTAVLRHRCQDVTEMLELQARLSRLSEEWIKPIEEYEFPMVTLNENTSGAAVCTIFETLNRTGVKLGVFDLLTARFWAEDLNLRKHWADAKAEFSLLEDFEIDPYYVLQVIGLLEPGVDTDGRPKAPSVKRSAILDMDVDQARKGWEVAVESLDDILRILRDDCGVLAPWLLPYTTILIPMAAVWATRKDVKGADIGADRLKMLQWFWCSIFGQRYENAPNSQAEKDFGELKRWMAGGDPPGSVVEFRMEGLSLRSIRPQQRAVYRGVMVLILQQGALDFHKRGRITAQLLADKKNPVDDHHIFPRAFLDGRKVQANLRDCVVNRTYIDRETNRRLSRRAPSDYFAEIRAKHGEPAADQLFGSHFMPNGSGSPLLNDDFDRFLEQREAALLASIRERTGGHGLAAEPSATAAYVAVVADEEEDDDDDGDGAGKPLRVLATREYWEQKVPASSLAVVAACEAIIRDFIPDARLRYKHGSIALQTGDERLSFVVFRPKQAWVRIEPRVAERTKWEAQLRSSGLYVLPGGKRRIHFRLNLADTATHGALLRQLFEQAYEDDM